MIIEKKLIIGIGIVSTLIEKYDDNSKDSAIIDKEVIDYCKNNYQCIISNVDLEEMIDILNSICSRKNFIQRYLSSLPMMFNLIVSTDCQKGYLIDIKNQLEEELDNLSNNIYTDR